MIYRFANWCVQNYRCLGAIAFCISVLFVLDWYGATVAAQTFISCGSPTTLSILSTNIGSAYQSIPYNKALVPSGGTPCVSPANYAWTASGLPTGVSIGATTGLLSGTPTVVGASTMVQIQVKDCGTTNQQTATLNTGITVYALKSTSGISIPSTLSVAVGATSATQTATLTFTDNSTISCTACVWNASGPATVVNTGAVTGIQPGGMASVTASFSGVSSNAEVVTVTGGTPPSKPTIVSTSPLPPAYSTIAYQGTTLAATGGTGGCCTWAVTAGSLSGSGLSLNTSTGAITGTGSTGGNYSITVTATDGMSNVSPPATFNVTVATVNSPVQISLAAGATAATLSTSGTAQITSTNCNWSNGQGGNSTPPVPCPSTLSYSSDATGVATVNSSGLISAVGAGTAHITASVTGCSSCTSNQITITVASGIQITTPATLPAPCDLNFACPTTTFGATGGSGTGYTWSITSGAPTGCGSSVTSAGVYNCTPTAAGTFSSFIVKVTDSMSNTVSKTFTQVVGSVSSATASGPTTVAQGAQINLTGMAGFSDGGSQNVTAGSAGLAVVQQASNFCNTANACTATFGKAVTSGDAVHVFMRQGVDTSSAFSVTDPSSQTYTAAGSPNPNSGDYVEQFYTENSASIASVTGHTAAAATSTFMIVAVEVSGEKTSSPVDATANNNVAGTATIDTSAGLTTTNANDFILDCANSGSVENSFSAVAPFTLTANSYTQRIGCEWEIVSATQSGLTAQINWTPTASAHSSVIAAFKAAGAAGAVWSASAGTGTCSVNASGVVTGGQPGNCTVSFTYGGKTSNVLTITITGGATDTAICINGGGATGTNCPSSPVTSNGTVGSTVQFNATGNVNPSNNYNGAPTVWASSNTNVATSAGSGIFNCLIAGSATITASNGSLTAGTATLTCSTASSASLLPGCTVSTSNMPNCSIPAGWSLVFADGFENNGGGCNVGQSSELAFGGAFTSSTVHTGSCAYDCPIPGTTECTLFSGNGGATGPGPYTKLYISGWEFETTNGFIGADNVFARTHSPALQLDTRYEAELESGNYFSTNESTNIYSEAPGTWSGRCTTSCFGGNGSTITTSGTVTGYQNTSLPLGTWVQWETLIQPNTCSGSTPNNDGFTQVFRAGVLIQQVSNVNINPCPSLHQQADADAEFGPEIMSYQYFYGANTSQCLPYGQGVNPPQLITQWSQAPKFETDGVTPCYGSASTFHVYLDDIIVMKQ